MAQDPTLHESAEHAEANDDAQRLTADGRNTLRRPSGSMYQYPRRPRTMMWFLLICGAALVIGGIYVAIKQFGQAASGGGIGDVVAGSIGVLLAILGVALARQGYRERPVDL